MVLNPTQAKTTKVLPVSKGLQGQLVLLDLRYDTNPTQTHLFVL